MVSPSKAQQKSHQHQVSHRKNLGKHLRIQRGPKPLEKKSFYLDIKNHSLSQKLENKIKELGGTIELFLIKSVELVISDKEDSKLIPLTAGGVQQQRKWGYASGGSGGGPPSLRSTEAPTPPTPYCSVEGPLSNYSTHSSKGQNILRPKSRVDAMLERALTQPLQCTLDPLDNALKWGIPVWSTHELVVWLDKITASLKETHNIRKDNKDIKVKLLREPFIKLESYQNDTRPVFAELKVWPMINFNSEPGTCPFENKIENSDNKKLQKKVTKENNTTVKRDKDMTRKPRVNVKTRKSENTGYCEICRVDFRSRTKHLQSSQHQNFIRNDNNFLSLDKLINTGANIEAFLMKNKTIDDSDCKVFANGAHKNIENGILLSDEKERKSSLNILKVEEENNKMVQCNGARRNLDLSLDSSHNLRTRQKPESGHLLRSKGRPFSDEEKNNKYLLEDKVIVKKSKGTYWVETDSEEDEEEDLVCEIKQKVTVNGNANVICADYKDNENLKPKINGYNSQEEKYDIENKIKIQETIQNENENSKVESIQPAKVHRYDGCKNRTSKKGKKMFKGRQRLSVEERLIEDNKQYYKVEVLNNKLRSSTFPTNNMLISAAKEASVNEKIKDEEVSSDKPVKLCFKRVRKSELSLLSNEAESFMFGEPKRDDDSSSEESENSDNNTSILPKDTESDNDKNANSMEISSSPNVSPNKQADEDLQDSNLLGRMKKKRLSQNEALIKDNVDYYKFETPGSRLRYQAPLTGISETEIEKEQSNNQINVKSEEEANLCTKPLAQVEKMHFSFEAVPTSEPWYQTYQRQDEGAEFWHYFSEIDNSKPFLLPYEIENFHEILYKKIQRNENRRGRGRGRGGAFNIGRSPRKSPRCHASTLAIMSTILKKNPNYQTKELSTIHEEARAKSHIDSKSVLKRSSQKSDVDEDLKELVKNIDKMFDSDSDVPDDLVYSHVDFLQTSESSEIEASEVVLPKGAPPDLLELMDKCPENVPTNIENSSYASSECGDLSSELPLKKRKIKKRTNKTGWPGNKLRKKVLIKQAESQEDVINRNENSLLSNEFNDSENDNKSKTTNSGKENETMNIIASSSRRSKIKKCKEKVLDTSKSSNRRSKSWNKSKSQEESTECESDGEASEVSQESTHTTPKHKHNSFKRKSLNKKVTPKSSIRLQRSSTFKRRVCCSTPKKQRPNSSSSPTKKHLSESSLSFSSPSHRNFIRRKHKLKGQTSFNSKSEKCKKDLFLKNARSQKKLKRIRKSNSASSDSHNGECSSSGQTSTTKTRDHRRSSMDNLQPIIRLPKIDGQVDLDNSSTVLRKLKSSSPTKSGQPPKKKFKSGPNNKRHSQNKSYSTKNS